MTQPILTGLTTAFFLTTGLISLTRAGDSQLVPQTQSNSPRSPRLESLKPSSRSKLSTTIASKTKPFNSRPPAPVKVGERQSQTPNDPAGITQVYSHTLKHRPAVTLYVRGIPVVTFLGQSETEAGFKVAASQPMQAPLASQTQTTAAVLPNRSNASPLEQATALAATLNQLHQQGFDAEQIRVSWDSQQQAYLVYANQQPLLLLNQQILPPSPQGNLTQAALAITNRLRRQLGNAPALASIPVASTPQVTRVTPRAVLVSSTRLTGLASWYGPGFHGARTASGEAFNQHDLTAAHRSLPFGTQVRVTNLNNGRSVVVRINDRGPFSGGRILDLSKGAARVLGVLGSGVAPVRLDVLR